MELKFKEKIITQDLILTESLDIYKRAPILKSKIGALLINNNFEEEKLLEEVLKFLYLVASYNQKLAPSYWVDMAWHEFILHTRLYEEFCLGTLGRFIHHTPDDNTSKNQSNYKQTLKLYILHFGKPPQVIWGELAVQEWEESQCGACVSE